MKVSVRKTTMVRPSSTTPAITLYNSNLDLLISPYANSMLFIYKHVDDSHFFNPKTLIHALEKTLIQFYPIAGRLNKHADGQLKIRCNAAGVPFTEAQSAISLDDLQLSPSNQLKQLVPCVASPDADGGYPACAITVTYFSTGGASVGVCIQHLVADGKASVHFIKSWSDAARGCEGSLRPFINRRILSSRDPPRPLFDHPELRLEPPSSQPLAAVQTSMFEITRGEINTLKANASGRDGTQKFTSVQVLTAHIWKCACTARGLEDDRKSVFYIDADCRGRFSPPLPANYFGNAVYFAAAAEFAGDLKFRDSNYTASRIRSAIIKLEDEYLRSAIDYIEVQKSEAPVVEGYETCSNPNLGLTSWLRLPLYEVDFGWGKPVFVCPPDLPCEGVVFYLPRPVDDGSVLMAIALESEHMKKFESLIRII